MKRIAWARMGILVFLSVAATNAEARIKLVALPDREETIVKLDNPANTLVEEERILALQKGTNHVDFSWKGVRIDPDSIRLKVLSHPDQVGLLHVSYPPEEPALVWEIYSAQAFEEKVRISYLLRGIDRLVTYKAEAETDESRLDLKSYLVLRNFSGEKFEKVLVQLDYGKSFEKSIDHEEAKRMLFFSRFELPIEKTFLFDAKTMPWDPEKEKTNVGIPVYYALRNTQEAGLGDHALWEGKVRIFQKDGKGSTIFLGEDQGAFTPVGEKMKLTIGESRDVVVTQRQMKKEQTNLRRNRKGIPVLYDTDEVIQIKVENFKDKIAHMILVEHIPGQWEMKECTEGYKKKDAHTIEFHLKLEPKEKREIVFHFQQKNLQ